MKIKKSTMVLLIIALLVSAFNITKDPSEIKATTTSYFGSTGANEIAMNDTMDRAMATNAGHGDATQKNWVAQLNMQWKQEMATFKWTDTDSITTSIQKDANGKTWKWTDTDYGEGKGVAHILPDSTNTAVNNPLVTPTYANKTFEVYSGEQLKQALKTASGNPQSGFTVRLMADFGYAGLWF